ncbi:hypothetical protein K458DRAFT_408872 [Lentithecium fluviatile CBS 122367]|uniref:DUF7820 domain-containing protein n=1 Tax=Lentithecium fluviatile CBS 122367 TaxID=1168545 RepID=A0A6G1IJE8_9PLEO|nr:hypothetical protein K458DRAFT_408872 [Lentithecium fluviatile CBS 122367]
MDRRNSKNAQPQRPRDNPDVFDDEHALDVDVDEDDFMPSVSDGFRPGNARENHDGDRQNHDRNEPTRPQITTTKSSDSTDLRRVATRNSTVKMPLDQDTTSHETRLPNLNLHTRGPSSQATPLQHRESVSSTASFATTARPESPLGTGPSHPYGMYPQNTMARSSSIATTSTQHQPQRSLSSQRPTHPYGMYSQNVVEDEEPIPVPPVQAVIPVGFPGAAAAYRRQIGPDGEEQDIIGLDGHTEQLPPYSRYPEEGPTKASMAAEASATPVEAVPNPRTASSDALLANEVPPSPVSPTTPITPVAPVIPALLPQQRPETQTGSVANPRPATNSESASLLTTEEGVSEKPASVRSVRQVPWRKRRLWGKIPVTVALVLLILLLIFAVILGAAIGTFLAKQGKNKDKDNKNKSDNKHDDPASQVSGPHNTLFDATPITTSVAPLPTGQFALPLGSPQESSPGCLTQGNQYSAWSCKMSFAPLILTITASNPPVANVEPFTGSDGAIQYGLQAPAIVNQTMQLVTDLDFKGYGPAWHFSAKYDKIVILTPEEFTAGSSLRKRQGDKPFRHRFQVQPGDAPWVCTWNQTYIEGYIYVQDNSTAASITGSFPSSYPTDGFGPPPTAVPTGSASTTGNFPAPTNVQKRQDNNSPPNIPRIPPYPRIVKIEERRIPGAPQPVCQKMQLLDDGTLAVAASENGAVVVVQLQEEDPDMDYWSDPPPPSSSGTGQKRRDLERRRDPSDSCHCQWMFQ